jgi:hypothetical protein
MKLKKTAAAILAAFLMAGTAFTAYAEENEEVELEEELDSYSEEVDGDADTESEEDSYITNSEGTYTYSINDDGTATLEEYLGNETKVVVPEEVDGIEVTGFGDYTYYFHEEITEITLSANIQDFGWFPFYGCTSLEKFSVNEDNPIYTTDEKGILFDKAGVSLMAYPAAIKDEEYTIPDGIICINSSAFACNPYLKKVTIPEGVIYDYFGIRVFAECTALETVVLPESLTEISDFCFAGCTSLETITFPDTLEKIDQAAFYNCTSLQAPEFPYSLTEIEQAAFMSTGFDQVEVPETVTIIGYSVFGFYTDEDDMIQQMDDFVVCGYSNSMAQSYCTENGITFVSLDDEDEDDGSANSSDAATLKRNRIIAGCVAGGVVIIVIAAVVISRKVKKMEENGEDEYYDSMYDDEPEDEPEESGEDYAENQSESIDQPDSEENDTESDGVL